MVHSVSARCSAAAAAAAAAVEFYDHDVVRWVLQEGSRFSVLSISEVLGLSDFLWYGSRSVAVTSASFHATK